MNDREALLTAALKHVPFEGMNERAIRAGADDIDMPKALIRVYYPQGGAGLAADYHRHADDKLKEWLKTTPPDGRFSEKIAKAVWHRLSLVDPELVRAGAATLALPSNVPVGTQLIWETADVIWRGLGDKSDDVNWYSKRTTLSTVIAATVLFWLGDTSENKVNTREFLDRRIEGVMRFEKVKASIRKIPGVDRITNLAFGWMRAPRNRNLPGNTRGD